MSARDFVEGEAMLDDEEKEENGENEGELVADYGADGERIDRRSNHYDSSEEDEEEDDDEEAAAAVS